MSLITLALHCALHLSFFPFQAWNRDDCPRQRPDSLHLAGLFPRSLMPLSALTYTPLLSLSLSLRLSLFLSLEQTKTQEVEASVCGDLRLEVSDIRACCREVFPKEKKADLELLWAVLRRFTTRSVCLDVYLSFCLSSLCLFLSVSVSLFLSVEE
jgi:hypothetical protein